ncbi:DUF308 domain-containing protein [Peptostreptococcus faecalis]|uniref:DUF308 domain-containing protein n=1 Tax=Peptostreptococcus faecalis TaxID=2045015 RepID=UPI000C7B0154|nr:DUF308 domain-containing protein [Peptostreptococcus faecalis]
MNYNFFIQEINNKKKYRNLIILGVILLAIGVYCLSKKTVGVSIFSWGIAIAFLYGGWISLKQLNELSRYESKSEINRARAYTIMFFAMAILLFVFPKTVNMILSIGLGIYILYQEAVKYLAMKNYFGSYFDTWAVIKLIMGVIMIISPLFLSRFLVSILSVIAIIFGMFFLMTGINIRNGRY